MKKLHKEVEDFDSKNEETKTKIQQKEKEIQIFRKEIEKLWEKHKQHTGQIEEYQKLVLQSQQ